MSLPYPFPFCVVAEPKRQLAWEVTVSLVILNVVELNLHPRPCPWYSLFLCWKGMLISQPSMLKERDILSIEIHTFSNVFDYFLNAHAQKCSISTLSRKYLILPSFSAALIMCKRLKLWQFCNISGDFWPYIKASSVNSDTTAQFTSPTSI